MITTLIAWIIQPKNAILTAIVLAFLTLFAHDRYLNHEVNKKEEEIVILNKNINDLKASIELQNLAIKNMNNDFEKQKANFESNYNEVKTINKSKLEKIAKKELYVSPPEIKTTTEEVNQGRIILKDFLKDRKALQ